MIMSISMMVGHAMGAMRVTRAMRAIGAMCGMRVVVAAALICGWPAGGAFAEDGITEDRIAEDHIAQDRIAPARGPERADSEVEVFLDFTNEACRRLAVVLEALANRHPDDVRIVFRHLTPENDPVAALPHRAAVAAERQGRFWDMERILFANQDRRSREDLIGMAAQLELDIAAFTRDLEDPALAAVIDSDRARAQTLNVESAPAVFINGKPLAGERTLKHLESVLAVPATTR